MIPASRHILATSVAASLAALFFPGSIAHATDGVWTNGDTGGVWGTGINWNSGVIANGVDAIANLSTVPLSAARTVNLGGSYTVGTLIFGDAGATFNTTLAPGSPVGTLTLATSTGGPTITVANTIAIISAKLAGTQGFTLSSGTLRLTGTANTLTGGIRLASGSELQFAANSLNGNVVDFTANSQLTWQGSHTQDVSNLIKIEDGVTATLGTGTGSITFTNALQVGPLKTASVTKTGSGTLTIAANNTYTGLTKINAGRIVLASGDNNRLAATGTIALGQTTGSGILQLGDAGGASNQTTTSLVVSGTGTANAVVGGNSLATSTLTINNAANLTYAGFLGGSNAIENNLALAKSGAGNFTISNTANTFTGGVTLNQGTLTFSSGSLGTTGPITFAGTSALGWAAGNTQDVSSRVTINDGVIATFSTGANTIILSAPLQTGPLTTGALTKGDSGTIIITAVNTYTGATRINNGRVILTGGSNRLSSSTLLQFGNAANSGVLQLGDATGVSHQTVAGLAVTGNTATSLSNAIVGGNSAISILTINNPSNVTSSNSPIFGGAGTNENNLALVKTGVGSLVLSKTNTFAGNVDLLGGALIVNNNNSLGVGPKTVTISSPTNSPSLQFNNASGVVLAANIALVTSNDDATAPAIVNTAGQNIVGGGITLADGGFGGGQTRILVNGGSLTLNGAIVASATAGSNRTLILDGAANGTANGAISDTGTVHVAVTKEGAGTWSLTAANSYSGETIVNAGRLNLTTAQTGTGAITVANGATLGVLLAGAGQSLSPDALTLNHTDSSSALVFELGSFSNPAAPLLTTGAFTTLGLGTNIIDIFGTGLSIGTFDLIGYSGSIGGAGFDGLALGNKPARVTAELVDAVGKVQLSITAFDVPKWTGATNGLWDVNDDTDPSVGSGTVNWKELNSGIATRYLQLGTTVDSVLFDDTAAGTTDVELTTSLSPTSVTVNNSTLPYTFFGSGKLTGATTLLKTGPGMLIIVNTGGNDYTGLTTINGGTLQIGDGVTFDGGQLGSGAVVIGAAGTLAFDRPSDVGQDLTFTNVVSGAGTIVQKGGNTVTLSGNSNAFDGPINVLAGTLKVGSANALGSTVGSTSVSAGATLDITGFSLAEAIALNGGTLKYLSGTNGLSGAITLTGGGIIDGVTGTLAISGVIGGSGGLTKNDPGNLVLTGANNFTGAFVINGGTITLSNVNSFTGGLAINAGAVILSANQAYTGGTTVAGGATLQMGASATATAGFVGTGDIALNAATGIATLNILRGDNFEIANNITSSGANASNLITIGATGATSASGTVTFGGANTFTGNITINGGALRITSSGALGIGPKIIRIGSNAGPALKLDGSLGNITLASGIDFAISSDGTIVNAAANAGSIVNVAGDNVINGRISQINGGGGNGRLTVQAGSLTVNGPIDAEGASGGNGIRTLLLGGSAVGAINGLISESNSVSTTIVGITKDGSGTWTINGANTFTGTVAVQEGSLKIPTIAAIGSPQPLGIGNSAITLGTGSTTGTLDYTGLVDASLARPITVNGVGGGILKNSGGALLTLSGTLTRSSRPLTFTGGAFNVTGQITGAAANLIIDGATVTLSQTTNNYVGPTTISGGGTLKNGASGVLPDTTTVTLGSATTNTAGTYDLNGFDETVTGLTGAGTGTKTVTNGAASGVATLTLTGTSTFAGTIQDGATAAVAVTKSTGGTFTAAGANIYSGATTVNGGTLLVSGSIGGTTSVAVNSGTLGGAGSIATGNNGNLTVANGGSLAPGLDAPGTLTLALGTGQLDASAATDGGAGWLRFELGTASDRIVLTSGSLNFGAGLNLDDFTFTDAGGFDVGTYVLFETNSAITAALGASLTGTVLGFEASLQLSDDGTDLVLQVVPEPSSAINLLGGLTALLGLQRFRSRSRRATAQPISKYSAS